jgi:hypothetical protein
MKKLMNRIRDLSDGAIEGSLVRLRRFVKTAELPDKLQR